MRKRLWVATQLAAGMLSHEDEDFAYTEAELAKRATEMADALLEACKEDPNGEVEFCHT